ncbi:hypothetical protein CC2G_011175 [Coprinopsis cinerea AmutBmut pab1-1]|nr:hypothetical protein CC2G_011175 [Coprinopsis cinerea AmutBmut pab1-1]
MSTRNAIFDSSKYVSSTVLIPTPTSIIRSFFHHRITQRSPHPPITTFEPDATGSIYSNDPTPPASYPSIAPSAGGSTSIPTTNTSIPEPSGSDQSSESPLSTLQITTVAQSSGSQTFTLIIPFPSPPASMSTPSSSGGSASPGPTVISGSGVGDDGGVALPSGSSSVEGSESLTSPSSSLSPSVSPSSLTGFSSSAFSTLRPASSASILPGSADDDGGLEPGEDESDEVGAPVRTTNPGVVAGAIVGGVISLYLLFFLFVFIWRRRKRRREGTSSLRNSMTELDRDMHFPGSIYYPPQGGTSRSRLNVNVHVEVDDDRHRPFGRFPRDWDEWLGSRESVNSEPLPAYHPK